MRPLFLLYHFIFKIVIIKLKYKRLNMAGLTEHVLLNKWDDDINEAITAVGGDTSKSSGLPDYSKIIRTQLVANNAIGEGIFQDFLFTNQDGVSFDPADQPTESTNAPQSKVVAEAIHSLYDVMARTERHTVLLVDNFPKGEINLSAVYLVRAKDESDQIKENTYNGCYYLKYGKQIKRIDIPEFTYDLSELFYLTRAEYDAGLSDYVKEIEDMLRKKFGKYWDDDGFTLDSAVAEIQKELEIKTQEILASANQRVDEAIASIDKRFNEMDASYNERFNTLESDVNDKLGLIDGKFTELDTRVDEMEIDINTKLDNYKTEFEGKLDNKFDTLKSEVDSKIEDIEESLDDYVKKEIMVELDKEIDQLK